MAPAPLRVRGPNGISTINAELDDPATVADLQQAIFNVTQIPPERQEVKTGYPPAPIVLISSLPISSLGLKRGDALVVSSSSSQIAPQTAPVRRPEPPLATRPSAAATAAATPPRVAPAADADQTEEDSIPVDGSYLVFREVPDDNSCLFSSIALVFEQDITHAQKLRQVVADVIREDPAQYTEAFLGRKPEEYISTILKPSAWGGAIELSIFSERYRTEISSFDVETGRCDRFGEGKFDKRVILMYSGIHYDATSVSPAPRAPPGFHQTVHPISWDAVMKAAEKLAAVRRAKRAYTNTATFDLRCQVCKVGLKGEKEAREHAKTTGHVEFGEY